MFTYITASAGSGKTYTLTRKYLELLARAAPSGAARGCRPAGEGYAWSEILAVTFTNKAAAEMKERVLRSLKDRALGLDEQGPAQEWEQEQARAWLSVLIRSLGSLNIRTIDSLLFLLVKLSALQLGLSPAMEAEFRLANVFPDLFDILISRAEEGDEDIHDLLVQACSSALNYGMRKGFNPSLFLRDSLMQAMEIRLAQHVPCLSDGSRLHGLLGALRKDFRESVATLLQIAGQEHLQLLANFRNFLVKCSAYGGYGPLPTSVYTEKSSMAECVVAKSRGNVGPAAENAYEEFVRAYSDYEDKRPLLVSGLEFAPLAGLAERMIRELEAYQHLHGKVLSLRWTEYIRQILTDGSVSEAFCRMGNRLRHILIDEFQDTSFEQWEAMAPLALEALSKGGNLCYVGDVKQSIYSWRGGDPGLFNAIPETSDVSRVAGGATRQVLHHNWRSAPNIIRFNNSVFGRLASADVCRTTAQAMMDGSLATSGLARLERSLAASFAEPVQEIPDHRLKDPVQGHVHLQRLAAQTKTELEDKVRENLHELLTQDILKRRSPGEVAILVRKNEQAAACASWLVDWSIPVVTENSLKLKDNPVVKELLALFRFLEYPLDDLAFWHFISGEHLFLRTSGLAPEDLHALLLDNNRDRESRRPLYLLFRERHPGIWQRLLAPFLSGAGFMPPYEMAWTALNMFRPPEAMPEHELFIRRFLENMHLAREQGGDSLSAFLEFWDAHGEEERAPLPENMDAVTVSTIHKAKGLEYPVVIVPFHHFGQARADSLTAVQPGEVPGLEGLRQPMIARMCKALGERHETALVTAAAEQLHMLYVAWTRPREELYCILGKARRMPGSPALHATDILLEEWDIPENGDPVTLGEKPLPSALKTGQAQADQDSLRCLPEAPCDSPGGPGQRLKIYRNSFEPLDYNQRQRGILAHRCLERLHHLMAHAPDGKDPSELVETAVDSSMRFPKARYEDAQSVRDEMIAMLTWLTAQEGMVRYLSQGRAEQVVVAPGGEMKRVDMVFRHQDRAVVLEYKTGAPDPAHVRQAQEYMVLLAGAMSHESGPMQVEGRLIYLDERSIRTVAMPEKGASHASH